MSVGGVGAAGGSAGAGAAAGGVGLIACQWAN